MSRSKNPGKDLSQAAKNYMEAHSRDRFSLRAMAGALYVNESYLLRTFRRETGVTPLTYHHLVRCSQARALLEGTDLSISEIGEQVGFVSSSHFSHIFRKQEGCTPSEYRTLHRENGVKEGTHEQDA